MTFKELGLNDNLILSLTENNISEPTDIQQKAIPHILARSSDIVAVAQTGTGKTAAFCLPLLQNLDATLSQIQVLVIVPTRELGQQVARQFFVYSKHIARVFTEGVYGGVPIDEQIKRLSRPTQILVATPGRLLDLLERKIIDLKYLKYLVLDEADEMMKMGFKTEIDQVLDLSNPDVFKMLFTATMPYEIKQIIKTYLKPDFVEIQIKASEFVNEKIEHKYLKYTADNKLEYLKSFLFERVNQRGIMFCRTKTDAKRLAKQLAGFEVTADALHGNLNQEMREKVMRGFRKNRINLLVATDIAARGLDVKDLDYIIHYDMPENAEYYVHRSGRTARAGKTGQSVCFIQTDYLADLKPFENELNISFDEIIVEPFTLSKVSKPITIFMNIGFTQGFTKANLVEFLIEEAGLDSSDINNIVVEDNKSHFTILDRFESQIIINLKGYKLMHRNLKISLTDE